MRGLNRWTNNSVEEELYEKAHIDYNRVAIVRQPSYPSATPEPQ